MIEFQPSAWEKGTYLNVSPQWLWLRMGAGHTDMVYRVGNFIPFKNAEQFTPLVEDLAAQAARRVVELRRQFQTLADVNDYFASRITGEGYPVYRAAIAARLMNDRLTANRLFDRLLHWTPVEWQTKLKSEAVALTRFANRPDQFRKAILTTIESLRRGLRLPPDPQCLESLAPKGE